VASPQVPGGLSVPPPRWGRFLWDGELRSALFLLWVESSLFCFKPRNQFPDPINGQLVVDRRGDPSTVLDLVVEFFALAHISSPRSCRSHDHKEETAD
jgi:hypothetical protein